MYQPASCVSALSNFIYLLQIKVIFFLVSYTQVHHKIVIGFCVN